MATMPVSINVTDNDGTPTVTFTYDGHDNSPTCQVVDLGGKPTAATPGGTPNPLTIVFTLDGSSQTAGWRMMGCQAPAPSPLTITPAPGSTPPASNVSYSVYDSDNPTSGGPYHVTFTYKNVETGSEFRHDPEIDNMSGGM